LLLVRALVWALALVQQQQLHSWTDGPE